MKQHYIDKKTGINYTLQGDYYLPDLILPSEENKHIGIWGQRHARYLKQNHKILYMDLFTSSKLNNYLADIDEQAQELFSLLVKQLSEKEGMTETLKEENQIQWVQKMNNIRNVAMEIVSNELICC